MLVNTPSSFLGNCIDWCSELQALKSQMMENYLPEKLVHVGTLRSCSLKSHKAHLIVARTSLCNVSTLENLKVSFRGLGLYFPATRNAKK